MVFNFLMFSMFLAITYFQLNQGAYSALIMAILTMLSVCLTFEVYETVAELLAFNFMSGYEYGVSFMTSFALILAVVRFCFDYLFPCNIYFFVWVDRPLATLFGMFTALAMTGMMAVGFQMLPFGPGILAFDPVGLVAPPKPPVEEQNITNTNQWRTRTFPMEFTPEYASELSRGMWLGQDEFAIGLYLRLARNGFKSEDVAFSRDAYGQDMTSKEFISRCWDWRIQQRFGVTPVGLRIPAGTAARTPDEVREPPVSNPDRCPIRVLSVYKFGKMTDGTSFYEKYKRTDVEPPNDYHVLALCEVPRGMGTRGWYMAPRSRGGIHGASTFPPIEPSHVRALLNEEEPAEFFSFAYWQFNFIGYDKMNNAKSFPLRAVLSLNLATEKPKSAETKVPITPGTAAALAPRGPRDEFFNELQRIDSRTFANRIEVRPFPPLKVRDGKPFGPALRFWLVFRVSNEFSDQAHIQFTSIPPDSSVLAEPTQRANIEWMLPEKSKKGFSVRRIVDDGLLRNATNY